jgi:hypothetical protein
VTDWQSNCAYEEPCKQCIHTVCENYRSPTNYGGRKENKMSTAPIQQDYHYQVDQQVSVNAFFEADVEGETVKFQVTSRYGSTPEKIVKTTEAAIEAYKALRAAYPLPERTIPQPPAEPIRQNIDDSGSDLPSIKAAIGGRLSWELKDGKYNYKVMDAVFAAGERGTKYGINVYPEVLAAANLIVDAGQPTPSIAGWRVEYILNDKGYPGKVTRLLPPK